MSKSCKSCNSKLLGDWCHICGQRVRYERFTIRNYISNLVSVVFDIENGLLNTVIKMTVTPGRVILDFIQGRTNPYLPPLKYAFTTLTLNVIAYQFYDYEELFYFSGNADELSRNLQEFAYKYSNILTPILFVPFMGLSSFIVNKKSGYTYAENFISMLYIVGHNSLYVSLLTPLILISGDQVLVSSLVSFLAYLVTIYQVCLTLNNNSRLGALFKSIAIPVLGLLLFIAAVIIITVAVVLVVVCFS